MGRRATLAWLVAVIAGAFMVVPTLASAQEQGSTEADSQITDEATADETTTTEDPATETPAAEAPADAVDPAEPVEPAPVEPAADTSKAPAPEASSTPAPAPAEAAAPEPAPAEVAAVEAKATSSPGNDGGGSKLGRAVARGGGDLEATVKSSESKEPGCAARVASDTHDTFPDDGSCAQSQFEGGLPSTEATAASLTVAGVTFAIWEDPDGTVNFTVTAGGPFTGAFYVKGGPDHHQCTFTNVTSGSCTTNEKSPGQLYGFSHLDVCVGENPPPPPPPEEQTPPEEQEQTPPEEEVLTQEEREHREHQQQQQQVLEQAVPPVVPTAVTPAPEEALPFTGLDTGWLVLLSVALLGSGVLLRRKVS